MAVAWLLLEAGVLAEASLARTAEGHPDRAFYQGKRWSALWYARNILPQVESGAKVAMLEDLSPVQIPDEAFTAA